MLPSTADGIVKLLCQSGMQSAWRSERRADTHFHAGFAPIGSDGYSFMADLPRAWRVVPEWGDWPYHIGWHHHAGRAVLIYCEGDISVEIADDHSAYLELLRRTTHDMAASDEDATRFLERLNRAAGSSVLETAQ